MPSASGDGRAVRDVSSPQLLSRCAQAPWDSVASVLCSVSWVQAQLALTIRCGHHRIMLWPCAVPRAGQASDSHLSAGKALTALADTACPVSTRFLYSRDVRVPLSMLLREQKIAGHASAFAGWRTSDLKLHGV